MSPQESFDYYLAKDHREVAEEPLQSGKTANSIIANPINELHLHPITSTSMSIKMPNGYRMAFSTLLVVDGVSAYLIKRQSRFSY